MVEVKCSQCGAPTELSEPCRYCGVKMPVSRATGRLGGSPLYIEVEDAQTAARLDIGYLFQIIEIRGKRATLVKFGGPE